MTQFEATVTQPISREHMVRQRAREIMMQLLHSNGSFMIGDEALEDMRREAIGQLPADRQAWDEQHILKAQLLSTPEGIWAWGQTLCREAYIIQTLRQENLLPTPQLQPY